MSKLGGFFARKPGQTGLYDSADETAAVVSTTVIAPAVPQKQTQAENPLELDEELFTHSGTQLGGDNEGLRNLLIDASAKIGELELIRAAVDKLVDPVGKALRDFETEKSERAALQTVLNNTRAAYGKLRNQIGDAERRADEAQKECTSLRQELATTQNVLRTVEATKAEIAIDVAGRRAQIAELESRLAQESSDAKTLRDENRRLTDRLTGADKRAIAAESELQNLRQQLKLAEDEQAAQRHSFEKASSENARLSRRLAEAEASLSAAQGRLRHVEGNFAEVSTEHARLASALDEANERHDHAMTTHQMRFDTLQARASATEKLLGEAREHLLARAEDIRDYDRQLGEVAQERDIAVSRLAKLEADRINRESALQELDQSRSALMERSAQLARAFAAKEAAFERSEEAMSAMALRVTAAEAAQALERQAAEQRIEELTAALRREKMERALVEGALESGRKDLARAMRELMALQRTQQQQPVESTEMPRAANANAA